MSILLKFCKKNIIVILLVIVGFALLIVAGNTFPDMGYIRDENPLLVIPSYRGNMQWVMLFSSFILTIAGIIIWKISAKRKPICISILILFLIIGAIFVYSQMKLSEYLKSNDVVAELNQDIITSESQQLSRSLINCEANYAILF